MEEKRKDTYIWPELAVSNMEAAIPKKQKKDKIYDTGEKNCVSVWGFRVRKDRICEAVSVDQGL